MNGVLYLGAGALLIGWPDATQVIFTDRAFVGDEASLVRVVGMAVAVIGWLYLFGGRSGARQIVAASVLDRLLLVPAVLVPLAIADLCFRVCSGRSPYSTRCSASVPGHCRPPVSATQGDRG